MSWWGGKGVVVEIGLDLSRVDRSMDLQGLWNSLN